MGLNVSVIAAALAFSLTFAASGGAAGPEGPELADAVQPVTLPILMYHHLDPDADGSNGAVISVDDFAAQMGWLREHGFTAVTIEQVADWLAGEGDLPERPVLITFDDGYYSNYEYAFPILQDYGLKAAVFVVTATLGVDTGFDHVTYDDLLEMAAAGVIEAQSHSFDAHRLDPDEGKPVLLTWTEDEIAVDIERFLDGFAEAGLAAPVAYAYPYGAYNDNVLAVLPRYGFRVGLTTAPGRVSRDTDPLQLPRLAVFPGTTLCQFAALLGMPGACTVEAPDVPALP